MSCFRLCPLASPNSKVTQACLNQTVLAESGSGTTRFFIENIAPAGTGIYTFSLQLPPQITCENCVLQWRYNAGKLVTRFRKCHVILPVLVNMNDQMQGSDFNKCVNFKRVIQDTCNQFVFLINVDRKCAFNGFWISLRISFTWCMYYLL